MFSFFKKIKNNQLGQGLVELIVAVAVIQIGLFSVWSLFLVNFNAEKEAEMRIVGANLSREGVELIKNIRDSNWLKVEQGILYDSNNVWKWDQGLVAGDYSVSFENSIDDSNVSLPGPELSQLYFDQDGFYTNSNNSGNNKRSPYNRVLTLKPICCDDSDEDFKCDNNDFQIAGSEALCDLKIGLDVIAKTTWKYSGSDRQTVIEDTLYNWR